MKYILCLLSALLGAALTARADELLPVTFLLHAPDAKSVAVAGEFNGFDMTALPMKNSGDGKWTASMRLLPGDYGYKFVVDGKWIFDPAHQARKIVDQLENSRLVVRTAPFENNMAPAHVATPAPRQVAQSVAAAPAAPPVPVVTWDLASYQRAAGRYNSASDSFQQYLQKRTNPSGLRTIENDLHDTVAEFEKIKDGAPTKYNVQGMIDWCNKLIFDVHSTMQVTR